MHYTESYPGLQLVQAVRLETCGHSVEHVVVMPGRRRRPASQFAGVLHWGFAVRCIASLVAGDGSSED